MSSEKIRMADQDLAEFKSLIEKKVDAAQKELAYLQGLIARKENPSVDPEDARYKTMEDGSMSMDIEQLTQMANRQATYINHLQEALVRIENKTYGLCRVTGKLIDKARLKAVPHATLSLEAKLGLVKPDEIKAKPEPPKPDTRITKPNTMKKLIVSAASLKKAFAKLGLVIENNQTLPVLKNLLCRVTPGQLELVGTNLDITILYRLQCEAKNSFEFLVTYGLLNSIIKLVGDCPVTIEAGKVVTIAADSDSFEIKVAEKVKDFPPVPDIPKKNSLVLGAEVMHALPIASETCMPMSGDRDSMKHVLLHLTTDGVTVASTDSYVVYVKKFEIVQTNDEKLLISQKVIKVLSGIETAKTFFHSKSIAFETDAITIIANRTENKFPNFQSVFPDDWPANLQVEKSDLMHALNKCALSTDQLKMTKITLSDSELQFDADDQFVNIHVKIPGAYTGTVPVTCVNSQKLSTLLSQIESDEKVSLAIHDANRPIVITSETEPGYKGLIMPMASPQPTN